MCLIGEERNDNKIIYDWRLFDFGSIKEFSLKNQRNLINSFAKECLQDFVNVEKINTIF